MDDRRRETAAELIRLLDASNLFSRCAARGPNKKILFDLGEHFLPTGIRSKRLTYTSESVWSLITVADWVSGVLAAMMREIILERGRYEWCDPDEPEGGESFYTLELSIRLVLIIQTHLYGSCTYSTLHSERSSFASIRNYIHSSTLSFLSIDPFPSRT